MPNHGNQTLINIIQMKSEPIASDQGRTRKGGVWGFNLPLPIGLSTKMHNKENITFLVLLRLF